MKHEAVYLLFFKLTLHVSGVNHSSFHSSLQRGQASLATLEGAAQKNMTSAGGCSYSFVYS